VLWGYAPVSATGTRVSLGARLLVDAVFAAGAALSFDAALTFYVELQTRPGYPESMAPCYAHPAACVCLLVGLGMSLARGRRAPAWGTALLALLALGALLDLLGSGGIWR
jgi:hypothetical protein